MYQAEKMKKLLGKKRWEMIEDYSYDCGVIDIAFKLPWYNPHYAQTIWVCEPNGWGEPMTQKEVLDDLKYFMDGMVCDWDQCPYNEDGTYKQ
jgi:hypothetical protein